MEEESKEKENKYRYITTEGPANIDSPLNKQIEEMKKAMIQQQPGTAEQLKQFYNSEQWKETREAIIRAGKAVVEAVTPVIERVKEKIKEFHKGLMIAFSTDPEIKKCYGIYRRTKNRRIRKKQISRINRIIKRGYSENGDMD